MAITAASIAAPYPCAWWRSSRPRALVTSRGRGGVPGVAAPHFHEGHAGAGLLASALNTVVPAPMCVVVEHPSLRDALAACDVIRHRNRSNDCDSATQGRLVANHGGRRWGDAPLPQSP